MVSQCPMLYCVCLHDGSIKERYRLSTLQSLNIKHCLNARLHAMSDISSDVELNISHKALTVRVRNLFPSLSLPLHVLLTPAYLSPRRFYMKNVKMYFEWH